MNEQPNEQDLNVLAQRVHKANEKWWTHPVTKERIERNPSELLMLVVTEISEACEGERKNLMDDKLPHRKMAEVEMADALIRLLDFAAGFGHELFVRPLDECMTMPTNKGEALYALTYTITSIGYNRQHPEGWWISLCIACIQDYCFHYGYDLWGAFEEKMAYNAIREDHTHEARLQAGGKQW